MGRILLATSVALLLLVAPSRSYAEDITSAKEVVQIHDMTDLTARVPYLVKEMASFLEDAQLTEAKPGVVVVRARPRVQSDLALILAALRRDLGAARLAEDAADVAKRVLLAARDNARTLEKLRSGHVTMNFESSGGLDVLAMLSNSLGLNLIVSPEAGQALKALELSLALHDVPVRVALDLLLEPASLRLTVDQGLVRILAAKELDPGRFRLDFVEEMDVAPIEAELEKAAGTSDADDMKTLVQALREEVRALREEVREVRSILEEIRDR